MCKHMAGAWRVRGGYVEGAPRVRGRCVKGCLGALAFFRLRIITGREIEQASHLTWPPHHTITLYACRPMRSRVGVISDPCTPTLIVTLATPSS